MLTRYDYFGSRFAWTKITGRLRPQLARLDTARREARRGTVSLTRHSRRKRERREKVATLAARQHADRLADLDRAEPPVGLTHCILWVGSSPAEAKAKAPRGTQVFGSPWLWRKTCKANPSATRSVYVDLSTSWDGDGTDGFLGVWNTVRVVTEGEYGDPDALYFESDEGRSRTYLTAWQAPVRGGSRMHALCLDRLNFILARLVSEGTRVVVKDWCPVVWPTEPRYRRGLSEYTRPDACSQRLRGTWVKAGGEWYAFVEHRFTCVREVDGEPIDMGLGEMLFPVNGTCRYFSAGEALKHGLEIVAEYPLPHRRGTVEAPVPGCSYPVTVDVYGLKMREVRLDYHQHVAGYAYGPSGQMIRQWIAESGVNWEELDVGEDAEESCAIEKAPRMWVDLSAYLRSDHGGGQLHPDQAAEVVGTYERGDEVLVVHGKGWQGDREDDATDGNDFVSSIVAWQDLVDDLTEPSALYRVMHHAAPDADAVEDETPDPVPLSSEVRFRTPNSTAAAWRLWVTIDDQVASLLDRVTLPALRREARALAKLEIEAAQLREVAQRAYGDSMAAMKSLPQAAKQALADAWKDLDARLSDAFHTVNADPHGLGVNHQAFTLPAEKHGEARKALRRSLLSRDQRKHLNRLPARRRLRSEERLLRLAVLLQVQGDREAREAARREQLASEGLRYPSLKQAVLKALREAGHVS